MFGSISSARFVLFMLAIAVILSQFIAGCNSPSDGNGNPAEPSPPLTREEVIPEDAVKVTPETDVFPPALHFNDWEDPVPLGGPVNTAGAEDSPFIVPGGDTFYFFFTPDVNTPPNDQLLDGVTGIWWTHLDSGAWSEPARIVLNDDVALDGAPFVLGDTLWFASVRAGNYGEVDFYTAVFSGGKWTGVVNAGQQLNQEYDVGELHITSDGDTMYCGYQDGDNRDIYFLTRTDSGWSEPVPVPGVNNELSQDQPFVTQDGNELWFTGASTLGYPGPAVFRSVRDENGWGEPEEIISSFAGEPSLNSNGDIYFVHHYFTQDMEMIEADIYVAYRK